MRTRFAPSPTGLLHVGGLRTALYSWVIAKQSGGQFLLRIEDTDQERSVPGAIENILHTLRWVGLDPDEGVMLENGAVVQRGAKGPYIQSERRTLYRQHALRLLETGAAYPCFCTPERLEQMRKEQQAAQQAPMYDRLCLRLSAEEVRRRLRAGDRHVLRMKIPRETVITFVDDIRGAVSFHGSTVDDQVLLKSDGFPTYHLAHVVDDHLMDIDLVIRGEEWLSSLPKHLLLFQELGWKAPRYAHVPLLLNPDRSKLSKRQGDVAAEDYRRRGYLPEALLNFLAMLGWNPGTTQEMFTKEDLLSQFSLERVQKSGAVFDLQKLEWLQGQWIRRLTVEELTERLRPFLREHLHAALEDPGLSAKVGLVQERITLLTEAPDMLRFFYEAPEVDPALLANTRQKLTPALVGEVLPKIIATLEQVDAQEWTDGALRRALEALAAEGGYTLGQVLWPLRAALTGKPYSPGAYEVAAVLGKTETIARLRRAANR